MLKACRVNRSRSQPPIESLAGLWRDVTAYTCVCSYCGFNSFGTLAEVTLDFGVRDPSWGPRAAAVVATARILDVVDLPRAESVFRAAATDESAAVRRVSGLLELELQRRQPPKADG